MHSRKDKRDRQKQIIIGVVIFIFVISSIAYVVLYRTDNTNTDRFTLNLSNGDYEFNTVVDKYGSLIYTVSKGKDTFQVNTLPQQLSSIKIDSQSKFRISSSNYFYFTFSPNDTGLRDIDYIRFNLRNNLPTQKYFQDGVTSPSDIYQLPIVRCNNATMFTPVIIFRTANITEITTSGNCVDVNFASYDRSRIKDLFVYLLRGINLE